MTSLECWLVEELLPLCDDAELDPAAAGWVRRHRSRCAAHRDWDLALPALELSHAEQESALAGLKDIPAAPREPGRASADWIDGLVQEYRGSPASEAVLALVAAACAWAMVLPPGLRP